MAEKNLKARIVHKHDIEANWILAENFTPKQGEIIVYDVDDTHSYERFKIGDGVQNVNDLPFYDEGVRESIDELSALIGDTSVAEQISEAIAEIPEQVQADWSQNDETAVDYVKNKTHWETPEVWAKPELVNHNLDADDRWNGRATCKLSSTSIEWAENNSYKVRIDGTEYEFNGMSIFARSNATNGLNVYYIGADYIPLNSSMDFTTYRFCFATDDFTNIYAVFEDGELNHTVEFFESEGEIHQIDEKYIPIATDDEIVEMLMQLDTFPVVTDSDGAILADENDNILLW